MRNHDLHRIITKLFRLFPVSTLSWTSSSILHSQSIFYYLSWSCSILRWISNGSEWVATKAQWCEADIISNHPEEPQPHDLFKFLWNPDLSICCSIATTWFHADVQSGFLLALERYTQSRWWLNCGGGRTGNSSSSGSGASGAYCVIAKNSVACCDCVLFKGPRSILSSRVQCVLEWARASH